MSVSSFQFLNQLSMFLDDAPMTYKHDIFISYRHDCETTWWMRKKFLRGLKFYLNPLRRKVDIFDDRKIRVGSEWPELLCKEVATSKLLMPILTSYYFGSEWCKKELALMLEREQKSNLNLVNNSESRLVIPICLRNGGDFPEIIERREYRDFEAHPKDVKIKCITQEKFHRKLKKLAEEIHSILNEGVPDFDPDWLDFTGAEIERDLEVQELDYKRFSRII